MASTQNTNNAGNNPSGKSNRGFASMDRDKQREIASKGGQAAHEKGTAHEFTSEEARRAGSKGGQSSRSSRGDSSRTGKQETRQTPKSS